MSREFVVHFEPFDGGSRVEAEVFVEALRSVVDAMRSMAHALAPAIAQRRSWSRALVKDALTVSFSAVTEGSLDIRAVHGSGPTGPMIDSDWIAEVGWEAMGASVRGAASGRTFISEVPLRAAEGFVRAARVTRDANVKLELRSRRVVKKQPACWRTTLDLTRLEPALSSYVERRSVGTKTQTMLVGHIGTITYSPPGFLMETGKGKFHSGDTKSTSAAH